MQQALAVRGSGKGVCTQHWRRVVVRADPQIGHRQVRQHTIMQANNTKYKEGESLVPPCPTGPAAPWPSPRTYISVKGHAHDTEAAVATKHLRQGAAIRGQRSLEYSYTAKHALCAAWLGVSRGSVNREVMK